MSRVVRIEHTNGRGLFWCDSYKVPPWMSDNRLGELERRQYNIPNARLDPIIGNTFFKTSYSGNSIWRFAYNSIEDVERYVTKNEMQILKEYDFKLYAIISEEVVTSEFQSIFNYQKRFVKVDITDYFISSGDKNYESRVENSIN